MAVLPIEDRIRALVRSLPIMIWETDDAGVVTVSEGGGLAALGFKPGQLVGQNVFDLYRDNPEIIENNRRALAGNEIATVSQVGDAVIESRVHPIRDESGKVTGTIGIGIDMTQPSRVQQAMRGLSRRLWSMFEEDRRRIARELHDEIGQTVTALKLELDLARTAPDMEAARARLEKAADLAGTVVEELRRVAHDLRPGALEELGLGPAVKALVDRFRGATGVEVVLDMAPTPPSLDRDLETAVYRFVQEALTNITRHASAKHVRVAVGGTPELLRIRIEDDGCGFVPGDVLGNRLGLAGMMERARILGGSLSIDSGAGQGARLTLSLPASAAESLVP